MAVPHASVKKGDNAKVAWLRERAELDKANGRIVTGRDCWSSVVKRYSAGT